MEREENESCPHPAAEMVTPGDKHEQKGSKNETQTQEGLVSEDLKAVLKSCRF